MLKLYSSLLVLLTLFAVAGCAGNAAPAEQASPVVNTQVISAATSTLPHVQAPTTGWVPPTALVGTPRPGAVATLTAAPALRTAPLSITSKAGEMVNMTVEIADTNESRELGLMFRSSMPPDAGMLFDFMADTNSGFWMQNTILPLSIAFIRADGTIIDIQDMQALDTTAIGPGAPYRYALETNQGFFRAHSIEAGDKAILPGAQSVVIPGMPSCDHGYEISTP